MKPIIEIKKVSKRYKIRDSVPYYSLRDSLNKLIRGKLNSNLGEFWALKNISFNVSRGESIGIIGANGAGKSTLLKILSKITSPTNGKIIIRGKLASLLEVGAGFHPELTGRENIRLYGAIMGMSEEEIMSKFDEIVSFSETKAFLDTPVKHYSSGMHTRLAFSVAIHVVPDILIIDEVLAVGDAAFQKKSINKMNDLLNSGCTILFVSHNMSLIYNLCKKSIFIEKGRIKAIGKTKTIIEKYLKNTTKGLISLKSRKDRTGNGVLKLKKLLITNEGGEEIIKSFDKIRISLDIEKIRNFSNFEIKMAFLDPSSRVLFRVDSDILSRKKLNKKIIFETEGLCLSPTVCSINIGVFSDGVLSDYIKNAHSFDIISGSSKKIKSYADNMTTILVESNLL